MKQVKVVGVIAVRDNGIAHEAGDEFEMEESMALAHQKAGQVRILDAAEPAEPVEADVGDANDDD